MKVAKQYSICALLKDAEKEAMTDDRPISQLTDRTTELTTDRTTDRPNYKSTDRQTDQLTEKNDGRSDPQRDRLANQPTLLMVVGTSD